MATFIPWAGTSNAPNPNNVQTTPPPVQPEKSPVPAANPIPQYQLDTTIAAPPSYAPAPVDTTSIQSSIQPYLDQLNASIPAQRARIDAQLQQALGELGQRRDAAAQIVAGLPGQYNEAYAPAQQALQAGSQAGAQGLSPGVAPKAAGDIGQLQAALAAEKASGVSTQPYLNLANMANYQGGAAALRQQAFAGQNAIDEQQRQFTQNLLQSEMQRRANEDAFYKHANYQAQLGRGEFNYKTGLQANMAQNAQVAAATGGHIGSVDEMNTVTGSTPYRNAVRLLTTGEYSAKANWPTGTGTRLARVKGADVAKRFQGQPKVLYALLANNLITGSDIAAAGVQLPNPTGAATAKKP